MRNTVVPAVIMLAVSLILFSCGKYSISATSEKLTGNLSNTHYNTSASYGISSPDKSGYATNGKKSPGTGIISTSRHDTQDPDNPEYSEYSESEDIYADTEPEQNNSNESGQTSQTTEIPDTGNEDPVSGSEIPTNPEQYIFPNHADLPPVIRESEYVTLDVGNVSNGILKVKYNKTTSARVKLLIDLNETRYVYDLKADNTFQWFPLQSGNGSYSIMVAVNVEGTSYMPVFTDNVEVAYKSENNVFLNPNCIVWFDKNSQAVRLAWNLITGINDPIKKAEAVHKYIISHISYDYDRASNVQPGYIPDIDMVLQTGKGICFDYAALYAAMMRALDIPSKLVMGYVSPQNVYHAWNEIYIEGKGWIKVVHATLFDKGWALVDTTFDAGGTSDNSGMESIKYQTKYEY